MQRFRVTGDTSLQTVIHSEASRSKPKAGDSGFAMNMWGWPLPACIVGAIWRKRWVQTRVIEVNGPLFCLTFHFDAFLFLPSLAVSNRIGLVWIGGKPNNSSCKYDWKMINLLKQTNLSFSHIPYCWFRFNKEHNACKQSSSSPIDDIRNGLVSTDKNTMQKVKEQKFVLTISFPFYFFDILPHYTK